MNPAWSRFVIGTAVRIREFRVVLATGIEIPFAEEVYAFLRGQAWEVLVMVQRKRIPVRFAREDGSGDARVEAKFLRALGHVCGNGGRILRVVIPWRF